MTRASLPACYAFRVFYEDTDAGGVVYHANYLRYCERARSLWLESLGLTHTRLASELGLGFVVTHADVEFKSPARLDDRLQVSVAPLRLRRASALFEQIIYCGERVLVAAQFTIACVKLSRFTPCALPTELRAIEARIEAKGS
ncbi:MAG TPA: YbgC/FadM family acyl-CoA thioesterase [Salinisphaeraceae bacterium]|nr:YbgC/FadM family acyl-CoA thioesterase [Salinisphaeraceae bacterium]